MKRRAIGRLILAVWAMALFTVCAAAATGGSFILLTLTSVVDKTEIYGNGVNLIKAEHFYSVSRGNQSVVDISPLPYNATISVRLPAIEGDYTVQFYFRPTHKDKGIQDIMRIVGVMERFSGSADKAVTFYADHGYGLTPRPRGAYTADAGAVSGDADDILHTRSPVAAVATSAIGAGAASVVAAGAASAAAAAAVSASAAAGAAAGVGAAGAAGAGASGAGTGTTGTAGTGGEPSGAGGEAASGAEGGEPESSSRHKRTPGTFQLVFQKEFGNRIGVSDAPRTVAARVVEKLASGIRRECPGYTKKISFSSPDGLLTVSACEIAGHAMRASVSAAPGLDAAALPREAVLLLRYEGPVSTLEKELIFTITPDAPVAG